MPYILIKTTFLDENEYGIAVDTDLPDEDLVMKILRDTLNAWDIRQTEGFDSSKEM